MLSLRRWLRDNDDFLYVENIRKQATTKSTEVYFVCADRHGPPPSQQRVSDRRRRCSKN